MSANLDWSQPCEYIGAQGACRQRSHFAYRAMGGGFMMLCSNHGAPHSAYSVTANGQHGPMCDAFGNPVAHVITHTPTTQPDQDDA